MFSATGLAMTFLWTVFASVLLEIFHLSHKGRQHDAMPDLDPYHLLEDINWNRCVKLIRSRPSELKTIWLPQTRRAIDSSDKRRYVELLGWHSCVSNDHIRSEVCPPDGLEDRELCWCVDFKGNGLHMAKWGHQEEALCIFPLSCLNFYNFRLKTSFSKWPVI